MFIKKIGAKKVRDSRGEKTIQVYVLTNKGKFKTSSPSGKSIGRYEVKPYGKNLLTDIKFINNLNIDKINKLNFKKFGDLKKIEKLIGNNLGGNSLFALEASLLKALAKENGKDLWNFLGGKKKKIRSVGNAIGGGLHSKGINGKKPDFQEFLFIANGKNISENIKINLLAYKLMNKVLITKRRNDEGAIETWLNNENILEIMKNIQLIIKKKYNKKVDLGLDIAASSFFDKSYNYKNPNIKLNKDKQIDYIFDLINKFDLYYIEDPLNENDFTGFGKLLKKVKKNKCLIVGDDLTTTNPKRLKKAIKKKSVNAIIVKPNQIGSLIKVKEVIDIAKKNKIKIIISHRSGETKDYTIADLAIGWGCDFIKTGIYGKVRMSKLSRLMNIDRMW